MNNCLYVLIYTPIRYFSGNIVSAWSSIAISIWAIGGLLMFSVGVVGEYIDIIYL